MAAPRTPPRWIPWLLAACFAVCATACTPDPAAPDGSSPPDNVVNPQSADGHQEVCLVQLRLPNCDPAGDPWACVAACTGALVAPNVVLTAAHCVNGIDGWSVVCPNGPDRATVQVVEAAASPDCPFHACGATCFGEGSDVALLRLERPVWTTRRATLAATPTMPGWDTPLVAFGRRANDAISLERAYASPVLRNVTPDSTGRALILEPLVLEPSDSGGPVQIATTGEIVAVNSAAAPPGAIAAYPRGVVVFAALRPAASWIQSTLARFAALAEPPTTHPLDTCAMAAGCEDCTSRPDCGWCNGACTRGSITGGGACTRAAGNWIWIPMRCNPDIPASIPTDPFVAPGGGDGGTTGGDAAGSGDGGGDGGGGGGGATCT